MEQNKDIVLIIKRPQGNIEIKLREPGFDEYRLAIMAWQSNSGKGDKLAAGEVVLKTCCIEGLKELEKDKKAYISACLEAVELITFYDSEIKKN